MTRQIKVRALCGMPKQAQTGYVSPHAYGTAYNSSSGASALKSNEDVKLFKDLLSNRAGLGLASIANGGLSILNMLSHLPAGLSAFVNRPLYTGASWLKSKMTGDGKSLADRWRESEGIPRAIDETMGFMRFPNAQKFVGNYLDWNHNDYKGMVEGAIGPMKDSTAAKAGLVASNIGGSALEQVPGWLLPGAGKIKIKSILGSLGILSPFLAGGIKSYAQLNPVSSSPQTGSGSTSFLQKLVGAWDALSPDAKNALYGALGAGGTALLMSMLNDRTRKNKMAITMGSAALGGLGMYGLSRLGYIDRAKEWLTRNAPAT